jgi:hypothetical protein
LAGVEQWKQATAGDVMDRARDRIDCWNHVEAGTSMTTTIWSDNEHVLINRTITASDRVQEAFVRVVHGSELDRLIAALQRARDRHASGHYAAD